MGLSIINHIFWFEVKKPKSKKENKFCPSEVRALSLGVAVERISPSEVLALPLGFASERSVHYFLDYFFFFFV